MSQSRSSGLYPSTGQVFSALLRGSSLVQQLTDCILSICHRDASKVEIKVLTLLRERDPENVQYELLVSLAPNARKTDEQLPSSHSKCIHLIHCFDYRNHICIVSELLSSSVFDFLKDNGYTPFPASHIQSFAKQLLSSVACAYKRLHVPEFALSDPRATLVSPARATANTHRPQAREHTFGR